MFTVKLTTSSPNWPWARQTPGSLGRWGDCQFVIDQPIDRCDAWVVVEGLRQPETTLCPPENTLLLTCEPEDVRRYAPKFLEQFRGVLTCQDRLQHPGKRHGQLGLPWHVGVVRGPETPALNYDDFAAMNTVAKTGLISVVCSNKTITRGHRLRLAFTRRLKEHFGDKVDVFGLGVTPVDDKWKAVSPYRYHVVIENGSVPDYWTEKLADAYLGFCFPLYWGCPNLEAYFPPEAFARIDIENPARGIAQIEAALEADLYDRRREIINESRTSVLDRYNLFELLAKQFADVPRSNPQPICLRPEEQFPAVLTWRNALRSPISTASAIWRGLRHA